MTTASFYGGETYYDIKLVWEYINTKVDAPQKNSRRKRRRGYWEELISRYPYLNRELPETGDRIVRVGGFIKASGCLTPSVKLPGHKKILDMAPCGLDHVTFWLDPDGHPVVMSESYHPICRQDFMMSGVSSWEAPQGFAIYRPDTHMVLMTLPRHKATLEWAKERLENRAYHCEK